MKITVVGVGYVGLAYAIFFSQRHNVIAIDTLPEKISFINNNKNALVDNQLLPLLSLPLNLHGTLNKQEAYESADYIIIATPTDYDPVTNKLNTESIESVIKDIISINSKALIIIRSTVPVGYTESLRQIFSSDNIIFVPEFLREGYELYDCIYPARFVIGEKSERAKRFADLLLENVKTPNVPILYSNSTEAEAIKLFSNTYLAMRVAYFNELDSFAAMHHINSKDIIEGVCLDPRIGSGYNNPSFGYGGYCLPKDTKQILSNFFNTPQKLMQAIVDSNEIRVNFIVDEIIKLNSKKIGFYRLIMKNNASNIRFSSTIEVLKKLKEKGKEIYIYEPLLTQDRQYLGMHIIHDLNAFKNDSDIIIANRISMELHDVQNKVYSRDLFQRD